MTSKPVREIQPTGDAFHGAIRRALKCGEGYRATGEFTVLGLDLETVRVCRYHLPLTVRESIVRTGAGVLVTDAVAKGECGYVA